MLLLVYRQGQTVVVILPFLPTLGHSLMMSHCLPVSDITSMVTWSSNQIINTVYSYKVTCLTLLTCIIYRMVYNLYINKVYIGNIHCLRKNNIAEFIQYYTYAGLGFGICSWNQPVLSNKGKVSCSRKQWGPLIGLEPTTSILRVRRNYDMLIFSSLS